MVVVYVSKSWHISRTWAAVSLITRALKLAGGAGVLSAHAFGAGRGGAGGGEGARVRVQERSEADSPL